ncbi:MAG: hypothetical protein R3C28_13495 [Pirellulaceae bacterium]
MSFFKNRSPRSQRPRLSGMEGLEDRKMMAGDGMAAMDHPLPLAPPVSIDPPVVIGPIVDFPDLGGILNPVPSDKFVGTWENINSLTGGITKIQITKTNGEYEIAAWGACVPNDCVWGKVDLETLGTSVTDKTHEFAIGNWDAGFKDATITLEVDGNDLIANLYNVFKDESGREAYHQRMRLTDSGQLIEVADQGNNHLENVLLGDWVAANPDTRGIAELDISQQGDEISVQGFGACTPTACDWGDASMSLVGSTISDATAEYTTTNWDFGFKTTFMTTRLDGGDLVVETYNVFQDGSGRENYRSEERLWKFGDSNHDGMFTTADIVHAFVAGEYEDNVTGNSTWEEGDWNRDGDFDTADLVAAFQHGGFDIGPIAPTSPRFEFDPNDFVLIPRDEIGPLPPGPIQPFAVDDIMAEDLLIGGIRPRG